MKISRNTLESQKPRRKPMYIGKYLIYDKDGVKYQ